MTKKILGLDLGTNSIGWALIEQDFENKIGNILGMGSRIIPMDQSILGEFGKGNSVSQTAERTGFRSARRLRERHLLRRERLHRVLNVLGFLPSHYALEIDFEKHLGKFFKEKEPKLVYNNKQFIFKRSFEEMLTDFKEFQPELLNRINKKGKPAKIPYDWTIYYLRKKALTQKIEKEELAWLMLNFNQKRGYYQVRGEEDEIYIDKKEYVEILKVIKIEKGDIDKKNNKKTWFSLTLNNGWIYSATFTSEPQWLNTEKEFLVIEELDENGNVKIVKDKKTDTEGKEKRRITPLPSFDEIDLMSKTDQDKIYKKIKAKTEITIHNSGRTVGVYIYDKLLQNPKQKINGKLVRTIERKFYKEELKNILNKQIEFYPELFTIDAYNDCVRELYKNNKAHQLVLGKRNFVHLFLDDIIFYQRPLRSQKSHISNCELEFRKYKVNGEEKTEYLKVVSKSNPLYQEFRIWQWLYNLKILNREDNKDVTAQFIKNENDLESLYEFLMIQKEVNHKDILKHFLSPIIKRKFPDVKTSVLNKEIEIEIKKYRWNYVFDDYKEKEDDKSKIYPCNETGYEIRKRLAKVPNVPANFLSIDIEYQLWHIVYSVTDLKEYENAIENFIRKYNKKHQTNIDEIAFKDVFIKFPPFKSEYGSYSEKAIKKLLPLLRLGKYWNWGMIDEKTKKRIGKIITGEVNENMKNRVREKAIHLTEENHFRGLPLWLSSYIVYDKHSEANSYNKWNSVKDLEWYLDPKNPNGFKQHSLRNPIVEQVVTETIRVVKDIWKCYGQGVGNFLNEIHIELGREIKNTAEERKRITNQVSENENTNLRIKALLAELKDDSTIENVRPFSPMQQEILKIYEEYAISNEERYDFSKQDFIYEAIPEDIIKISKTAQPTKSELMRYKLWLEQKYRSPYTGEMIPLNSLFTADYEIEHIIPQSLYFDDSFSNKVICESAVNKKKDHQLGLEFIKNYHGEIIDLNFGKKVKIFTEDEYRTFIKQHYNKNRSKLNKLLLEEIPEKMIERQMNDTRYISKFIMSVLSNIVRADKEDDGVNSKNIVPGNGRITDRLKQDWGLNDVWNDLILPRFERMNEITKTKNFTSYNEKHQKDLPTVPFELSKGFQKKRIDHRHHAMDALIIACATRDHVNLLNNQSAKSNTKRYDLQRKLRKYEKVEYIDAKTNKKIEREVPKDFLKPWENFTIDTKNALEKIVISFKQNLRVINKAINQFESYKDENGNLRIGKDGKPEKEILKQTGTNWSIRKKMHKDTVSGKVELKKIKVPKGSILTATRKNIDVSFDIEKIKSITDTGIQKILRNYLASKDYKPELAFSPEGIEYMNKNIKNYNDGKLHQPIYKARVFESGNKFPIGQTGNKITKYVETAKGTNLFFVIYSDEKGKRNFETLTLNEVIEHQKWRVSLPEHQQKITPLIPIKPLNGDFLFYISPNDLVYVPVIEEKESVRVDFNNLTIEQRKRLYNVNDFSTTCYFIPNNIAKAIAPKEVDLTFDKKKNKITGSYDTKTSSLDGMQIKDVCIKLNVDRLGNISKV